MTLTAAAAAAGGSVARRLGNLLLASRAGPTCARAHRSVQTKRRAGDDDEHHLEPLLVVPHRIHRTRLIFAASAEIAGGAVVLKPGKTFQSFAQCTSVNYDLDHNTRAPAA